MNLIGFTSFSYQKIGFSSLLVTTDWYIIFQNYNRSNDWKVPQLFYQQKKVPQSNDKIMAPYLFWTKKKNYNWLHIFFLIK